MTLYKQVAKYIYPVLRKHGFKKESAYWCRKDPDVVHLASVTTSRHGEAQEVLQIWLGSFSIDIEGLYCQRVTLGIPLEDMPAGLMFCHFETNFWCLDQDLSWSAERAKHCFFPRDTNVSAELLAVARKLDTILPNYITFFGNLVNITEYKMKGFGMGLTSTGSKLQAAAGCIVLGRYEEAADLIKSSIKAGSSPFHREIAQRLSSLLQEKRPSIS